MKPPTLTNISARIVGIIAIAGLACAANAQTLVWEFNETNPVTTVTDSSGNGNNGTAAGNVASNGAGGFTGFTSNTSQVTWTSGIPQTAGRPDTTLAVWFENPGNSTHNTIAGFASNTNDNRAWEIWLGAPDINGNQTINLSGQSWEANGVEGAGILTSSTSFSFAADTRYYLAFTWESLNNPEPGEYFFPYGFAFYLAQDGDAELGAADFSGTMGPFDGGAGGPGDANEFYVGGQDPGYVSADFAGGSFGGDIDSVTLWWNQPLLTQSELNANFLVPEPATVTLLASGLAAIVLAWRRRR